MPTGTTVNVRSDNKAGMRELARHLVRDHGYRSVGYLAGHADSPDNLARQEALAAGVTGAGVHRPSGVQTRKTIEFWHDFSCHEWRQLSVTRRCET